MNLDPEVLKQLYATFAVELEEQLQLIINSLLEIEAAKEQSNKTSIDIMFRAAHTIKGAANSISFIKVAKVAHALESLFAKIKSGDLVIQPVLIDRCLIAVDAMKSIAHSYFNDRALEFDPAAIISQLDNYQVEKANDVSSVKVASTEVELSTHAPTVDAKQESLRVDVQQLEKVSSLLDEVNLSQLAIAESSHHFNAILAGNKQLTQTWKSLLREINKLSLEKPYSELSKLSQAAQDLFAQQAIMIESHAKELRQKSYEMSLQDSVLQDEFRLLRLTPAGALFQTMPRHVRDLGRELGKEIELVVEGDDVRVDRMILDAIKDPIIHILRNAVDHGIENADVRDRMGKRKEGMINIKILDKGNQIAIQIKDDGSGIDYEAIRKAIVSKKIFSENAAKNMNEKELINVLFMPGFSTKSIVTNVSGRGVGLDVVKSNLEKIKGSIEVTSVKDKGVTFSILVPLTLSSECGLLVKASNELFAIPAVSVERILRIKKEDLMEVAGKAAVMVDGQTYPAYLLASLLELLETNISDTAYLSAVIIKNNQSAILLLVDEAVGEREIVIKPIQPPLSRIRCVSGSTLTEGGHAMMVLNPAELIQKALHQSGVAKIEFSGVKIVTAEKPSILVVDDSITTRTLEKNILESKGFNVSVAVNGKEAWDYIQKKKFSLIITDVNMPIMDGFQLTEKIKKSEKYKSIPVIIVTSLDSDEEKRKGLEVGANAYIVKNEFESGALIEVVNQLV